MIFVMFDVWISRSMLEYYLYANKEKENEKSRTNSGECSSEEEKVLESTYAKIIRPFLTCGDDYFDVVWHYHGR